jgi:hypothetical protein
VGVKTKCIKIQMMVPYSDCKVVFQ